jgi:acetyltransferase-like isoleucine patch superfamily enzyme
MNFFSVAQKTNRLIDKIGSLARNFLYQYLPGLQVGRNVFFSGNPIIDIRNGGVIMIGDDVTINSRNFGYHLNLQAPVKLFADRPGARIVIGDRTRIHGSCIHAYASITIGKRCLIAGNCQIIDGSAHDVTFNNLESRCETTGTSKPIVIEDDVWIGANVIILPGVTIGRGSIIGAGSVVTKNIPAMVIAAGNPAAVLRTAGDEALRESA